MKNAWFSNWATTGNSSLHDPAGRQPGSRLRFNQCDAVSGQFVVHPTRVRLRPP